MVEKHLYLVPNYYPDFHCKMGACRAACCQGWPISLSMRDYFRLLGVDCSSELRRKLDCAMHMAKYPTEEDYAQINPRYDGDCPLRMEDGRCAVHAELGEEALSYVCRLYPRAPRAEGDYECSCANSCEGVLETLFRCEKPLEFTMRELEFDLPVFKERTIFFETVGREQEIRLYFIRILQERQYPLHDRLMRLGLALRTMDEALKAKDAERVERILQGEESEEIPIDRDRAGNLEFGMQVMEGFSEMLDARSDSVRPYGEACLAYFRQDCMERYRRAKAHFEEVLPHWERYMENMLVNHMFFTRFPFQDRPESLWNELIAICGIYALMRFLGMGWMADKQSEADFVDVMAATFRLIDHTSFDRYASRYLRDLGCNDAQTMYGLLKL